MSALRGVAAFSELWERRTSIEVQGEAVDLLALPDLVLAKKTQRDKDWPMIRRLVERSYFARTGEDPDAVLFWLRELRTPELLTAVAGAHPDLAARIAEVRPAVSAALGNQSEEVAALLMQEQQQERRKDREYWEPLRRELEILRRSRRKGA